MERIISEWSIAEQQFFLFRVQIKKTGSTYSTVITRSLATKQSSHIMVSYKFLHSGLMLSIKGSFFFLEPPFFSYSISECQLSGLLRRRAPRNDENEAVSVPAKYIYTPRAEIPSPLKKVAKS